MNSNSEFNNNTITVRLPNGQMIVGYVPPDPNDSTGKLNSSKPNRLQLKRPIIPKQSLKRGKVSSDNEERGESDDLSSDGTGSIPSSDNDDDDIIIEESSNKTGTKIK